MSGTTAFTAKANLVSLLRSRIDSGEPFEGVDIWYGYQGQSMELPRELIWVGEIEWDFETPEALGNLSRDEQYRILLTVEVHNSGSTQEEANARVEQLFHEVELLLRQKNPLNIPNTISVGIDPQLLGEGQDTNGRGAILVSSVLVHVRK